MASEKVMLDANERQVGGSHYQTGTDKPQHWDIVHMFDLDYFQGNITKYLFRWRQKGGLQDLHNASHYLQKYIELAKAEEVEKSRATLPVRSEFPR